MEKTQHSRSERRRFNSYQRPFSCQQINDFYFKKGYSAIKVEEKEGRLQFGGIVTDEWKGRVLPIASTKQLTFGQWLDEVEYLLSENPEMIKEVSE